MVTPSQKNKDGTSSEALLREEIHRRCVNQLFEAADRLTNLGMPPLTESEVDAEIEAARRSRRTSDASRR